MHYAHLRHVEANKDTNKMTWGNIAIVIGPNILRPRRDTMETMLDVKDINTLVEFLFETIAETQKEEESSSAIERKEKQAKELEKSRESKRRMFKDASHIWNCCLNRQVALDNAVGSSYCGDKINKSTLDKVFANLSEEEISDDIFRSVQEEALQVIRVTLFNRFLASTAGRQLILQAAGENVVREGYLKKSKKNRSWKKRFCVLYGEPPILRYYKSSSEIGEPQGEIDLSRARLVNISDLSGNAGQDARSQFVMDVENLKKGTQRFYFSCAVASELEEWMTALRTIYKPQDWLITCAEL